ncbi:MAG: hypothetical protein WCP09_02935 [Candidatus Taylorbacteria bacterium]
MKNSQKGFVMPLLIAVIALLVIGGVYVYENKKAVTPVVVDTGLQQLVQQQTDTQAAPATTQQETHASVTVTNSSNVAAIKSIDACNTMERGLTRTSECYVQALESVKSSSLCGMITDDGYKNMCYMTTAPIEKSSEICNKIQSGQSFRDSCFMAVAEATKNPEICDNMTSDSGNRLSCYDVVGPSKWYLSVCQKKLLDQNITANFLIGKQYSELVGPDMVSGTFNSDGTIVVTRSGGGYPAPTPVVKTNKWRVENGYLIIEGEFTGAIKDAKFYKLNGEVFAILGNVRIGSAINNPQSSGPLLCP